MDILQNIALIFLWPYGIISCCMCFYVFFSSGEGIHWFTTFRNCFVILGAVVATAALPFFRVPSLSLFIAFSAWSVYAALVAAHYWRFRLWRRHLIPVNMPLVVMFLWEAYRVAEQMWN
ncbi:hypothetical protein, unlikely [Trypanosoma brucei gambiense DAL972]|uniref:Uncharacterized protein n=2 Tax=Trypanosoma brucei TaxID=5691 RepID=D0A8D8_TRYB9|nr:hypothetical protein, unlikely [Trypanosoma brucei gambiense DAL972]RHW68215.1 hypothetical protein DPX39_110064800 [Trypanosoma brucei equiperdum]CBH17939.1 hypothetical protein, unlikely [Trypanosoma brucei gambiense DAL972]|eukprot:XP_011780203.1 hypothetical protein, unlikely [Trypanosoma brucei gambiense DAL972]